jgi:hypothetical protein
MGRMTHWLVNDLSLGGQYATPAAFWVDLAEILKARQRVDRLATDLLCSADLSMRPVTAELSLLEAIYTEEGPRRYMALRWITKGPFWETVREPVAIDMFEHEGVDVTEQGLGEAARRLLASRDARSFSFPGLPPFDASPLSVTYLREDENLGTIIVLNHWTPATFAKVAGPVETERSRWGAVIDEAVGGYAHLIIARSSIVAELTPYPFDSYVAERILQLLGVLEEIAAVRLSKGDGARELTALLNLYFVGSKAQFSDESKANKRVFRGEMTFPDPENERGPLFCPWHGKIRTELPYRIHFEWPIPKGQEKLKVVYIGPKITRH